MKKQIERKTHLTDLQTHVLERIVPRDPGVRLVSKAFLDAHDASVQCITVAVQHTSMLPVGSQASFFPR